MRQELVLVVLAGVFVRWIAPELAKVERRREEPERKRADAERHVETAVAGEALESLGLFRFGSLAGRSWRDGFSVGKEKEITNAC